jgi:tetratricopeptide (TPR) repeat protein
VRYIAVSPDGRLVATGSHTRTGVKIWDAQSGKPVKELPADGSRVGFSPNGKWLMANGRLWANGSWQPGPLLGSMNGAFAFSRDSKLLALETGYGVVRLVNPDTGRECARLEDPNQDRACDISFSPDGTQLVACNGDSQSLVHVWDLRAIREELAKMGLDWDLRAYPPAPKSADVTPLQVQVDRGELDTMIEAEGHWRLGRGYLQSRQWDKASAAYAKAIELDPKNAKAQNNLAWLLSTCPDATFRDADRALALAKKAVELTPHHGTTWNTLGVSHYRAGDWKAAAVALEKSNDLLGGKQLSFNAFFLAMAHKQLGDKDEPRQWYEQAAQWMEKNKPQDEELRRFRAEAAALLEVKEKKD